MSYKMTMTIPLMMIGIVTATNLQRPMQEDVTPVPFLSQVSVSRIRGDAQRIPCRGKSIFHINS